MNNYMGNSAQYDNNNMGLNQPISNIFPSTNTFPTTNLFNQPTSFVTNGFNNSGTNMTTQQFDPALLNGTNLDDDMGFNSNTIPINMSNNMSNNMGSQDPSLIKSVAREIINGLKENNMSLYDNSSINSQKKNNYTNGNNDDDDGDDDTHSYSSSKKSKKSKHNKVKEVVETIEDFVTDVNATESPQTYSSYAGWFFDDCFNYKDFLILFVLYFVLSQEMIKDFFAKYFSSLNPDYEGKIGVQGVIIYGLVLTILFMVLKKIF